jgi:hypothetical protein
MPFVEDYNLSGGDAEKFVRLINNPFVSESDLSLYTQIHAAIADALDDDSLREEQKKPKK